ncbi:hypothetical protein ACQ4PT_002732 [Festuca glaucescens]
MLFLASIGIEVLATLATFIPLSSTALPPSAAGTMEADHTSKLQNLNITSDESETEDDAKALQQLHITSDVETETDAESDYIDDDYNEHDDDYDEDDEDLEPRVWLDPVNLPSGRSSCCDFCGDPLRFVLQDNSPIYWKEAAYHRTLFVFMCPSMACLLLDQHEQVKDRATNPRRSVKVLRCQLPKNNAFYTAEDPIESQCSGALHARLCDWCGTWKGENLCNSCKKASYCSVKHQELHWCASHENDCCRIPGSSNASILPDEAEVFAGPAWPEYMVVYEDEPSSLSSSDEDESELMVAQEQVEPDLMMQLFMDQFEADEDNTYLASFLERISRDGSQVLRYCGEKNAEPLWAASTGSLAGADIPLCIYCNGPLGYEF